MSDAQSRAIDPGLFEPAGPRAELEQMVRPSRPYWSQVGARLARNPRALFGGGVIVLMVLAVLIGPWLWPLDPARQSLNATSQGASGARPARLVIHDGDWGVQAELPDDALLPAAQLAAPTGVEVVEANTEWVRLRWQPVPGALRYHVYRHVREPRDRGDLGLPLGPTFGREQVGFEDRLQLQRRTYFYSVVASDGVDESQQFTTVRVQPVAAIALLDAQIQGIVPADADPADWRDRDVVLPAHPLGTDYLGRDLLARLLHGGRTSLFIGLTAPLLFIGLGVIYGATAGFLGGRVDNWMMRFADFVVALPFLLFMILLRIAFGIGPGESGVMALMVAMLLMSWPASARLVRGQVLQLREEGYVSAARLAGGGNFYIIVRHMLPNLLGVVLVALTFAVPSAIFTEAFLSFIGMGVVPPTPSWGSMSNDGVRNLLVHPRELLWPALCISLTVLAFNMLGDALRDALDVTLKEVGQ
jgi:oligopeptide transport system permease protein